MNCQQTDAMFQIMDKDGRVIFDHCGDFNGNPVLPVTLESSLDMLAVRFKAGSGFRRQGQELPSFQLTYHGFEPSRKFHIMTLFLLMLLLLLLLLLLLFFFVFVFVAVAVVVAAVVVCAFVAFAFLFLLMLLLLKLLIKMKMMMMVIFRIRTDPLWA